MFLQKLLFCKGKSRNGVVLWTSTSHKANLLRNFEVLIWARWFKAINMRWNVNRSMCKWARQRYCAVPNPVYSFFPVFWHFPVKASIIWGFTHFWWELRVLKIIRRIKVRLHSKTFKDSKKFVFVATGNFWENLRKIMLRYQRETSWYLFQTGWYWSQCELRSW